MTRSPPEADRVEPQGPIDVVLQHGRSELPQAGLLQAVLGHVSSAVCVVDEAGRVLLRNDRHRELGCPPELKALAARSLATGEAVDGAEVQVLRNDGRLAIVRAVAGPLRDDLGRIVAAVVTFDDVTEQRRATERLALLARVGASLTRSLDWDSTLRNVVDVVLPALGDFGFFDVVEDDQGPLAPERVRRLARAPGDPERQAMLDATRWAPSTHPDLNLCALTTGTAALHEEIDEAWLARAAASPEHLEAMRALGFRSMLSVPVRYEDRILGALTLFVTDPARAYGPEDVATAQLVADRAAKAVQNARLYRDLASKEAAVRAALAVARDAERHKDEFLAMLGHELRNPMAPIVTALELMRRRDPTAHEQERVVVERQARHLMRLVDDLLDVARIARGKIELHRAPIDLATVVEQALETASPLLEQRGHRVTVDLAPELHVDGDPERLAQVFANLLTNAARYTEPGGRVGVAAREDGGEAVVTVRDDGVGMAPEVLASVFDRFVQGPGKSAGGLGLGLAIVRGLVELHGGTVRAESEGPGRGCTFEVRLPRLLGADRCTPAPAATRASESGAGRRLLVVDDNRDAGDLLGRWLATLGYDVRVVADPVAALDVAPAFRPELALLDIGLPVMDGYTLGTRLRASPDAPICVSLTGYGQREDHERSAAAGFAAHLVKPVDLDLLAGLLDELLGASG